MSLYGFRVLTSLMFLVLYCTAKCQVNKCPCLCKHRHHVYHLHLHPHTLSLLRNEIIPPPPTECLCQDCNTIAISIHWYCRLLSLIYKFWMDPFHKSFSVNMSLSNQINLVCVCVCATSLHEGNGYGIWLKPMRNVLRMHG